MDMTFRYRPDVLEHLELHGLRPTESTDPSLVRDHLSDVYCWELRRLRQQLLARAFPKAEYAARVVGIRRRYLLLSVPLDAWLRRSEGDGA